ncbi:outer membrane protein assembly factor BamB family protein [Alienimonas californiensis]|nr:PQQ-binding-like beta-propeller repeat protein [Alienimonas californiensis]
MLRRRLFLRGSARDPRRFVLLAALCAACCAAAFGPAQDFEQEQIEDAAQSENGSDRGPNAPIAFRAETPMFNLDRSSARQVELARRALNDGGIAEAIDLAALAARATDDSILPDGTPVRAAAADVLLEAAKADARLVELRLGAAAEDAYEAAAARGDLAGLATVAARFPGSAAGRKAAVRVADLHLDRGEYAEAARLYDGLIARSADADDRSRWRMKAAAACQRTGDSATAAALLSQIPPADRALFFASIGQDAGLDVSNDAATLAALDQVVAPPAAALGEWPWVGRLPGRAIARPGEPAPEPVNAVGGPIWTENLTELIPPTGADGPGPVIASSVRRDRAKRGESLWPASRPLALRDDAAAGGGKGLTMVYATPAGVTAADAATGEVRWKSGLLPDSDYYRLTRAEEQPVLPDSGRAVTGLLNLYEERAYRDATAGALSADDRHVYAVRNLDLPKRDLRPDYDPRFDGGANQARRSRANRLVAYERHTGRTAWTLGGPNRSVNPVAAVGADDGADGAFFCGPPLPTPQGLAVLAETGGVLRLLVLDPADGTVMRALPIGVPALPLFEPPRWREAALGVSAAAGLWIVPSSAGGVAALDPLTGSFVWTYRYQSTVEVEDGPPAPRRGSFGSSDDDLPRWVDQPPKVAAGRALLTPRDSEELHCLDLATGDPLWIRPRGTGRQIAGVVEGEDGLTALLVGDDGVRALALADGAERWFAPLPPAAGDAVLTGDVLIVPLADDTLAAVRTQDGGVLNRLPATGAAGNLIAAGGRLLSQTPEGVAAFPTRKETAARIEAAFATEGADRGPALLLRAGLALQEGRHVDAVSDLIAAAEAPAPQGGAGVAARFAAGVARDRLSEALADGLRRDFAAFAPLLREASGVLGDPPVGEVARAYADGLSDAGRRREAFRVLAQTGDGSSRPDTRADAWARRRLPALFTEADAAEREAMVADVAAAHADAGDDIAALEAFAQRFGRLCASTAWRDAAPRPDGAVDLADEALRRAAGAAKPRRGVSPLVAARLLRWAASRPGAASTDAALADLYEAAGDPLAARFLRGDAAPNPTDGRRIEVAEASDRGRVPATQQVPVNGAPPWSPAGRLTSDTVGPHLHWQADDGRTRFAHILPGGPPRRGARALWDGHLLIVGLGDRIEALDTLIDPTEPRALWRSALHEESAGDAMASSPPDFAAFMARGAGFDGPAVLTPRQLVLRSGSTLAGRHPLTASPLWRRTGLPSQARVIGDDRVLIVLPPTGTEATLLSADDGGDLGTVPAPPMGSHWLERGTRVWSRTADDDGSGSVAVACTDLAPPDEDGLAPAPPRVVWSRTFPPKTAFHPDDAGRHLTAVTLDRRAIVLDLETGAEIEAADLGPGPAPAEIWGGRTGDVWTVFLSDRRNLGLDRRLDWFGDREGPESTTWAYGLRGGAVVWSRQTPGPPDDVWQAPGLPLLAVPGMSAPDENAARYRRRFTLTIYDARNGAELFVAENFSPLTPVNWEIDPAGPWSGGVDPKAGGGGEGVDDAAEDAGGTRPTTAVRLRTRGADLEFTLSDEPPAAPVRTTPATPDEPKEEGS